MIFTWDDYKRTHPSTESFISKYYHFHRVVKTYQAIYRTLFLRRFYAPTPIRTCLDIGCYRGFHARQVVEFDVSVDAIDLEIPPFAINHPFIEYHESDFLQWDTIHKYDLILLLDVYEHFPPEKRNELMDKIFRLLNDGGMLLFSAPNRVSVYRGVGFLKQLYLKVRGKINEVDPHFLIPWVHYNQLLETQYELIRWETSGVLPMTLTEPSERLFRALLKIEHRCGVKLKGLGTNYLALAKKEVVT